MTSLALYLTIAIIWMLLTGRFTGPAFLVGLLVAAVAIGLVERSLGRRRSAPAALLGLVAYFLWELLLSNLRVARAVLSPRLTARPGIVRVPLAPQKPWQATVFANMVTMTPGTLSIDVDPELRAVYVHVMFLDDADAQRAGLKGSFERRILEVSA
ncbi:MAG TPA: Na+/H+ antiporter subunit E [Candidatus Thermoplasmatota archaeon]|nr:Na+/H+ antiporter subunit E [Candidatus Thermoplasmatota archaeon]